MRRRAGARRWAARSAGGCTWSSEPLRAGGRRRRTRRRDRMAGDEGAAAVAQAVEQRVALAEAGDDAGAQARPERGGDRELEARVDLQLGRERARVVRSRRGAQQLVERGELGRRPSPPRRVPTSSRRSASRWAARASSTACSASIDARAAALQRGRRGIAPLLGLDPLAARGPASSCSSRLSRSESSVRSSASSAAMRSAAPPSRSPSAARRELGGVALVARGVVRRGLSRLAGPLGPQRRCRRRRRGRRTGCSTAARAPASARRTPPRRPRAAARPRRAGARPRRARSPAVAAGRSASASSACAARTSSAASSTATPRATGARAAGGARRPPPGASAAAAASAPRARRRATARGCPACARA